VAYPPGQVLVCWTCPVSALRQAAEELGVPKGGDSIGADGSSGTGDSGGLSGGELAPPSSGTTSSVVAEATDTVGAGWAGRAALGNHTMTGARLNGPAGRLGTMLGLAAGAGLLAAGEGLAVDEALPGGRPP